MNDRLKAANDGEYNNLLLIILVIAAIYLVVRGWSKSKQQTYLDNLGTDLSSQQAAALRDAMNRSGVDLLIDIDGTDVDLIMQTAQQITNYKAVADAYRVIYNDELTIRLQKELSRTDFINFNAIVSSKAGSTATTGGTTSTGTGTTTTTVPSNIGKGVTASQTVNYRIDDAKTNYPVESNYLGQNKQAKAGNYLGTYVTEMVIPNIPKSGDKLVYVKVKDAGWGLFDTFHWFLKNSVKIG